MSRNELWHIGKVTEINAEKASVRVAFSDLDGLVSHWLPVVRARSSGDQLYWMPDVGEQVLCLLDAHAEFGVVLGAVYSSATPPPVTNADQIHVAFKDGTVLQYDRAEHKLTVQLTAEAAEIDVSTTGAVNITSSAASIVIAVADGQKVSLGGAADAQQLATKEFVTEVYKSHTHPTPAGISGTPVPTGTEDQWPNVTQKAVGQ